MSYLDEVPFRTALSLDGDSGGQNTLITAPAIDLPDCADILMSTMVSRFCLCPRMDSLLRDAQSDVSGVCPSPPNWLLAGVRGGEDDFWWVEVREKWIWSWFF